jgi:flagellar hook-associated protein 1 FlgK
MSILNIGTQALQANLVALQTAGNNIANVNTPGYSRQKAVLATVPGQYTGAGYIGKGVSVETIVREFSTFLTRQSALASSTQYGDTARADKLKQLEGIFPGGTSGLGASINDMLNSFSDVASSPTDLTARTVTLTRIDETASRMRAASQQLDDLQAGTTQELGQKVNTVNSLAQSIADVNGQIARVQGSGQPPNDLLDRRDQLIRDLNQYVQTTSIPATDGTVGIFLASSQALVLGTDVSPVSLVPDDFGDPRKNKLAINRNGVSIALDENALGGGEISGLLRFQNNDLNEGRNLLGRMTMAISTAMNDQHHLGLDLDGNFGGDLFTPTTFNAQNVRAPVAPAALNTGTASMSLSISDVSKFAASDYLVNFTVSGTALIAEAGTITRLSDGTVFNFPQTPPTAAPILATIDGLNFLEATNTAKAGDRFLIKPFSTSASDIRSEFSTPRALAVASPVAGTSSATNLGTLTLQSLLARSVPAPASVTLTFNGAGTYTRSDTGATTYNYVPGQAIEYDLANPGATGWSLVLQGAPKTGDTFVVQPNPYTTLNAGNATAMMNLRDQPMFDGAALTDGYAGLISQVGIRSQSASYAAQVSGSIANNLEKDRTSVSGVNLDEEAAKLIQYQQAYQASAKMIQIAQNIFDTLMQGLVR